MADNLPPTSTPSNEGSGQSLRWSLQNFPVPVQLQARLPRSPLSMAQELLPNFPPQLMGAAEEPAPSSVVEMTNHQYQLALQQQAQQQLQQQFQRQLQLNLQGGGESSRGAILPEPPDTTLDIDIPGGPPVSSSSSGSGISFGSLSSSVGGASGGASDSASSQNSRSAGRAMEGRLRRALNSAHFSALEALFRNPQATSMLQRNNSSSEAGGGNRGNSQSASSSAAPLSHFHSQQLSQSQSHPPSHHLNHHHHHHQHNLADTQSVFDALGTAGSGVGAGDGSSGMVAGGDLNQIVPGSGAVPGGVGNPAGAGTPTAPAPAELSLLYKWLAESGIFVFLLLLHFLYDHRLGLLVFLCTGGTFYYTNMKLVHAIHQSAVRDQNRSWIAFLNLMWLSCFLMANVCILYYVFAEQRLWRLLFFQMATVPDISVWTLLWCVVMTDYIIKFLTVVIKALLAMMQPCFHNYRKRGKYYLLIESLSQLYRQLITVVPWLYYLNDSTRTGFWFAFLTEAAYLGFKGWAVWGSIQYVYSSIQRFQSNTSFGKKPSSSDLLERGSQCPICQDTVSDPVMLPCKHIFCEHCVSIWFDREKTCPMCRAQIIMESPIWKDGNTSAHLQWH